MRYYTLHAASIKRIAHRVLTLSLWDSSWIGLGYWTRARPSADPVVNVLEATDKKNSSEAAPMWCGMGCRSRINWCKYVLIKLKDRFVSARTCKVDSDTLKTILTLVSKAIKA